jgi:flagellar assembly protein FliH
MIRRIPGSAVNVDNVIWPGLRSNANATGAPALQPAEQAARLAGQALPAGGQAAPGRRVETAEFERRIVELERLRQLETAEAHHRGVEDGLRRGREEASAEVKKAFDEVARTLEELSKTKRKLRHEAEQELVKLSLAVARRILYREISTDPSSIEGIVHAALEKLQQREASRVRVYPAGVPAVRAALDRIGVRAGIEVVADPGLTSGGILFETTVGELDASVETQLQEIQRGFADRLAIR